MQDARQAFPGPTLGTCGFALVEAPTRLEEKDFKDEAVVRSRYYEEIEAIVKTASGARDVYIFDHTLRETGAQSLNARSDSKAAPVNRVHCDYTAVSALRRLLQLADEFNLAKTTDRHFAFINVWRSIDKEQPVEDLPLALCDPSSVSSGDKLVYEMQYPERIGENFAMSFSKDHRWSYFPHMTAEECLVFKVFEQTDESSGADDMGFVFHTAFEDPRTPPGAPTRRSIEARCLAFF